MQVSSFHFGPHRTPPLVKGLLISIFAVSLLSPIVTFFLHHFFHVAGPQEWLILSLQGIREGKLWQLFTYFFVNSGGVDISFSLLISLAFLLFLLWFVGSEIYLRLGSLRFLTLYLGGGIFAGAMTTLFFSLFSSGAILYGSYPAVFSVLSAWSVLYSDLDLYFFFFIRFKAKWIVLAILGLSLLSALAQRAYFSLIAEVSGILWGYFWVMIFQKKSIRRRPPQGKIIDIETLKESDDAFMDRMLDKIARQGKNALTEKEKRRMRDISQKKS